MTLETMAAVLSIVVIDLTISGDNALVIGMAAHRLPPHQRRLAILLGSAGAVGLRVLFAGLVALLMSVPLLQAIGGLLLAWIAFRLLVQESGESDGNHRSAVSLMDAVRIIILADVVMSLDNILAVAGASRGDMWLLLLGLGLSIPIVMFGSGLVAGMMSRFRWLVYLGAGILAWISAQMVLEDRIVGPYLPDHWMLEVGLAILVGAAVLGASNGWRRIRSSEKAPG